MSPYIPQDRRDDIPSLMMDIDGPGELNYYITAICLDYLDRGIWNTTDDGKPGYREYNEVMGVLTCVQHELYRKRIAKYEDIKCEKNGEVF